MIVIKINGEIGWETVPRNIAEALNNANGEDLEFHIASPGGSVFDGFEIFNLISDYKRNFPKAKIDMIGKGIVASMATYIFSHPSASSRIIESNTAFMIHNAWSFAAGDHIELVKMASVLEKLSHISALVYSTVSGKELSEIKTMMNDETWFFGEEILESGFASEIILAPNGDNDKKSALANGVAKFLAVQDKIKKSDLNSGMDKIAALIKIDDGKVQKKLDSQNLDNKEVLNINQNNEIDKNKKSKKNLEGSKMDLEKLKSEHPELYTQVIKLGVDQANANISELMEMKAQKEYKELESVQECIDDAIRTNKTKAETMGLVLAVLSKPATQAEIESPEAIGSGAEGSASGEKGKGKVKESKGTQEV